jgi:hypothetical protein
MVTTLIRRVPYIGPLISSVGLAIDIKDIVETSTPIGAAKTVGGRLLKECTPPELFLAGKCIMLVGGVIASFGSGGNPLIVSGTISAARSIVKDV